MKTNNEKKVPPLIAEVSTGEPASIRMDIHGLVYLIAENLPSLINEMKKISDKHPEYLGLLCYKDSNGDIQPLTEEIIKSLKSI